jgi:hypothetical protein
MKMPLEIGRVFEMWLVSDCNGRESAGCLENAGPGGEPRAETGSHESDGPGGFPPLDAFKRPQSRQRPAPVSEAELESSPT